jgi:hypothetical protein
VYRFPKRFGCHGDAAEAAFRRKLMHYKLASPELAAAGIIFRPLVWTADGRPHPAATRTLRFAAESAARRWGQDSSAKELLARWRHEIQVAIERRRAAMTRAVLPRPSAWAIWLRTGHADELPRAGNRAPPLDAEHHAPASDAEDDEAGWAEDDADDASLHEGADAF